MKTVYLATAYTRNFDFKAVGSSEQSARDALMSGLSKHAVQYQLEPEWWKEAADINCDPIILGETYRDGSPLNGGM